MNQRAQRVRIRFAEIDPIPIVFVVDDDISVRESLEALIRFVGWQPETFASAEEFLTRPRPVAPCCLVLDVSLPELNGLELQKLIAPDRIDMPIIFITGHGDIPMTVQAMKRELSSSDEAKSTTMRCECHSARHRAQSSRARR